MILDRLKTEAADLHLATEALMPFHDPHFDLTSYVQLLRRMHRFFVTWQQAVHQQQDTSITSIMRDRDRLPALQNDLKFFAQPIDADAIPSGYLPDMRSTASCLGSMYVVEGSTLGGQLIARTIETKFSLAHGSGYSFFVGAGPLTGQRWKAFGRLLTEWARTHEAEQNEIVAAARQTFDAYGRWVGAQGRRGEDKAQWR